MTVKLLFPIFSIDILLFQINCLILFSHLNWLFFSLPFLAEEIETTYSKSTVQIEPRLMDSSRANRYRTAQAGNGVPFRYKNNSIEKNRRALYTNYDPTITSSRALRFPMTLPPPNNASRSPSAASKITALILIIAVICLIACSAYWLYAYLFPDPMSYTTVLSRIYYFTITILRLCSDPFNQLVSLAQLCYHTFVTLKRLLQSDVAAIKEELRQIIAAVSSWKGVSMVVFGGRGILQFVLSRILPIFRFGGPRRRR